MNLLLLCDEYPPGRHGGIGAAVQLLARTLVQQGHRVVVAGFYDWGYGGEDYFTDQGVEVYRFRRRLASAALVKRDSFRVRLIYRLLRDSRLLLRDIEASLRRFGTFLEDLIRRYSIDIVEMPDFQDYTQYCTRPVYFPRLPVPVVVKLHSTLSYLLSEAGQSVPPGIRETEKHILDSAAAVVSVSRYTAVKTAGYLSYQRPIEIIRNGITITGVAGEAGRQAQRVVFTGALMENKGVFQLMKAWNRVWAALPEARLEIFGKGPVEAVASLLHPAARSTVLFHGHVPREGLTATLRQSAVGVFPSFAESFALAPIEAMAAGAAVIYTTRTSGPELIQDGVTGLLQDPADEEGLAEKIIFLLSHPEERARLAEAGRSYVASHLDISAVARQSVDFYKRVLSERGDGTKPAAAT